MKQESFKVLEYKRILSRLAEKAGTKLGKELALGLLPVSDSEDVKERLRQTAEAVYVSSTAHPPLGGIKDIRESIKKIGLGAVLDPAELLDILTTMYAMREIKRFFKELEMEAPILKSWARNLEILGQLERNLEHIVDELENQRLADFQQQAGEFSRQAAKNIRQGIANIQQELLRRQAKTQARDIVRPATKGGYITVVADNIPRVKAALANGARRIVFGGESYSHENITLDMCRQAAELAHEYGAAIVLNTPRIIRDGELARFHSWLKTVDTYPIDAISVHNIGTLHAVRQLTSLPIEADYSLISYNVEALRHLQELGADRVVLSPELNMAQLEKLGQESPLPLECLVDAHLELMVSEYCCTGSFLGGLDTGHCSAPCVAMKKKFYLKDRKNIRFPLVMDQYCHMHLLNANRLSMLPHAMKFRSMGIAGLRIDGRYLAPDKLGQLVKNYGIYMARRKEISEAERPEVEKLEGRNITRGHYFRGVL